MNNEYDRTVTELVTINRTLENAGELKVQLSYRDFCEVLDSLYQRRRELIARLRSYQQITKDDLRYGLKGAHYES
jgi:hypothetical protein